MTFRERDLTSSSKISTMASAKTEKTAEDLFRNVNRQSWLRKMMTTNADQVMDPDGRDCQVQA